MSFSYDKARLSLKVLVTAFLLFVGIGYIFGLMNIHNNVGFSYTGVVVHYRGSEKEMTVPPEFAFSKMVQQYHVHLFSLSMLFFMVGMLFSFTNLPEPLKVIFIAAPFLGMFLDFSSLWLTTFFAAYFGWFSMVFGFFMALSFLMLMGRPLYEMWILPLWKKKWNGKVPWFLK